jgi:hypothetical protein
MFLRLLDVLRPSVDLVARFVCPPLAAIGFSAIHELVYRDVSLASDGGQSEWVQEGCRESHNEGGRKVESRPKYVLMKRSQLAVMGRLLVLRQGGE